MKLKTEISFFCPAYNDEKNLPILIPKTVSLLDKISKAYEIIIINDASPDKTGLVADNLAKKYKNVKVLHHQRNRGYGGALLSGFKHAKKYPLVFFTDGDNQYDVNMLHTMLKFIEDYDAVIGYRNERSLSYTRKLQSYIYNKLIRFLFNSNFRDINCAIRLFKADSLKGARLNSKSAFLPAQILLELKRRGKNIKEIEVKHFPRLHGKASGGKPSLILSTFADMIKYYFKTRF